MKIRVGFGYDVHAFVAGRPLLLGGIKIPSEQGLSGHSDADALIHALVDALLGAAALKDIGTYFPSQDERWKDAPGSFFLHATMELLRQKGWRIGNIDATIVAERPRMAPHVPGICRNLAGLLHLEIDQVNVKATTTDALGFTGREEGIACYASVLLEKEGSAA
jgi:2-C-methyl-D-erythritol 2,4-cyclodiphosphate synthase